MNISQDAFRVIAPRNEISKNAWLEIRRRGIGSTDAAAIMGYSKYRSPLAVYTDKKGKEVFEENKYTRWGLLLEPVIRDNFVDDYNAVEAVPITAVADYPFTLQSIDHPRMICDPDGLVEIGDETVPLEIKTGTIYQQSNWGADELPDQYYCQVQHILAVMNMPFALVVALIGKDLIWRRLPRNNRFIEELIAAEERFWKEHIEKDVPPLPTGSADESDYLRILFEGQKGTSIELPEREGLAKEYKEISARIAELSTRKTEIKNAIMREMGDAEKAAIGSYVASWSRFERTDFDKKRFQQEQPDLYTQYCKKSATSRFEIREKKK